MDVIKKKHWWQSDQLKWSVIGLLGLLVGYLVVLMYVQGEYLFAIMTLILSSAGLYIFANRKTYAWRYVYPGLAGMGLFVLFPLVCTIAIAFTNYSSTNQLTFERAQQVLMNGLIRQEKPITSVFTRPATSGNWPSPTEKRANITCLTHFPSAANKNYS